MHWFVSELTDKPLSDMVHEQGRDRNKTFLPGFVGALLAIMDVDNAAVPMADGVIIGSIESEKIFVSPVNITKDVALQSINLSIILRHL